MDKQIFALDIGTRSVTGLLLTKQDNQFAITDFYTQEHDERSIRDGQIHNVMTVAKVIKQVKTQLEAQHGPLTSVCVAAAGRSLKTIEAKASIDLNQQPITDTETVKHIELSAVQQAQESLSSQHQTDEAYDYYCVGYSVLYYLLDGERIGSLMEQRGNTATVEIIATFLPKVVIESLMAALKHADLKMEALTLEPIAAIHILIPDSMRRLNVALVDIGAGTSDIAITNNGTVVAYGMVPVAGDEITEAVSDQYLLDFPKAEAAKRQIMTNGEAEVEDILGFPTTVTRNELTEAVSETVTTLGETIATEIIEKNAKPPKAVMLVGGGSRTPDIAHVLAKQLQLPDNRVAVRGIDAITNIDNTGVLPTGPDFVTPIGIAITASERPVHYIHVQVNNQDIRLFEMNQITVGDCFIQAGVTLNKWYGKPGIANIVTVNEQQITIPGALGTAPTIYLNGRVVSVHETVTHLDQITIVKGQDGNEPYMSLDQLIGKTTPTTLYLDQQAYTFPTTYYVNGNKQEADYLVKDHDQIEWTNNVTLEMLIDQYQTDLQKKTVTYTIYLNQQAINIKTNTEKHFLLNGEKVKLDQLLQSGDQLTLKPASYLTLQEVLKQQGITLETSINVTFNEQNVTVAHIHYDVYHKNERLTLDTPIEPEDQLTLQKHDETPPIFQDIFRYVDIERNKQTRRFNLYQNGQPTSFDAPLHDGDTLQFIWGDAK